MTQGKLVIFYHKHYNVVAIDNTNIGVDDGTCGHIKLCRLHTTIKNYMSNCIKYAWFVMVDGCMKLNEISSYSENIA